MSDFEREHDRYLLTGYGATGPAARAPQVATEWSEWWLDTPDGGASRSILSWPAGRFGPTLSRVAVASTGTIRCFPGLRPSYSHTTRRGSDGRLGRTAQAGRVRPAAARSAVSGQTPR